MFTTKSFSHAQCAAYTREETNKLQMNKKTHKKKAQSFSFNSVHSNMPMPTHSKPIFEHINLKNIHKHIRYMVERN